MPELRLPELAGVDTVVRGWARDLVLQLRRQWVPLLRRLAPLSPYGLQAIDGAGTVFTLPWLKVDVVTVDVAISATALAFVRPGLCFAVFAQNLTTIVGPTSYQIGTTTPADTDAWAALHEVVIENLESTAPWLRVEAFTLSGTATDQIPRLYTAPTDIILTPNGGAFVSGKIKLYAFTLDFKPSAGV